jgi:outer membrane protein assembly factor BamB
MLCSAGWLDLLVNIPVGVALFNLSFQIVLTIKVKIFMKIFSFRFFLFSLLAILLVSCPELAETPIDVNGNWNVVLTKSTGSQNFAVTELQQANPNTTFSGVLTFTSLNTNGGTINGDSKTGNFKITEINGNSYVDVTGKFKTDQYSGIYTTHYSDGSQAIGSIFMQKYTPQVSILIQPSSVSIFVNEQYNFSAKVYGAKNTGVIWSTTCGKILPSGQYTAPATPMTCEVSVSSVQDPSKIAKAAVTISKTPVTVSIQPTNLTLYTNEQHNFVATVNGAVDSGVTWSTTCGMILPSGQYTAPTTAGTCEVSASSVQEPDKVAKTIVTVLDVVVSIEPKVVTLETTDPKNSVFTASIFGPSNKAVTWTVSTGTFEVLGNQATFQVPSSGELFYITATSQLDSTKSATAKIIVKTPVGTGVWANIPNWFTFQANELHNGFVPITLNSEKFSKSWILPLGSGLSPVTDGDGKVFVTSSDRKLRSINASNGQVEWTKTFTTDSLDPPANSNGMVYVATGGQSNNTFLWALNPADGSTIFRSPFGKQWESHYAPTPFKGNVYIAGGTYGGSYGFNGLSGDQLWFTPLNQYDQWTPAVDDTYVYAYTGSYSPKLDVINRISGQIEFSIPDPNFDWSGWSMNLAPAKGSKNDVLAIHNGRLIEFDLIGKKIGWEIKDNFVGQPTLSDGKIFVQNNGELQVRNEIDGSLIWKWIPPNTDRSDGTMILVENYLFLGAGNNTYAIDLNTHKSTWEYPSRGHLSLSNEGKLYIASTTGELIAIDLR